jgi:Molybdopterin biosynthesis enzyme
VVLVSGGSSAGQRDFTVKVFASIPEVEILAHGVAISPGKPLIMAKRGQQSLWGLPGHAASALVCAEVFIRPLLKKLLGVSDREVWRRGLRAVLSRPVASAQGRRDYIRVRLDPPEQPDGHLVATPVMGKSGLITTLVMADALVVCPEDLEGLDAGQLVDIHLSL